MRIDFYLLQSSSNTTQTFVCKLLQKILQQKLLTYLFVQNEEEAKKWDALLWTFNDISFIPHALSKQKELNVPIFIGQDVPPKKLDVLINLTDHIPEFYTQFSRIAEIVPHEENARALSRKKYQTYQKLNLQLNLNKI